MQRLMAGFLFVSVHSLCCYEGCGKKPASCNDFDHFCNTVDKCGSACGGTWCPESKWTPPEAPEILGDAYIVDHVDLSEQVIVTVDGRKVLPAEIVEAALPGFLGDAIVQQHFNEEWFGSMVELFAHRTTGPADLQEFLTTGKSYNMTLKMNLFAGPSNWNFGTHVHKNIEYMKVLAGTLREYRSEGLVSDIEEQDVMVPLPADGAFHNETTSAGQYEVNEFGSLHTSYTLHDGMLLLTLYNGDWFFGVDGCQNVDIVCTPNGAGKTPDQVPCEEACQKDWTLQYVEV